MQFDAWLKEKYPMLDDKLGRGDLREVLREAWKNGYEHGWDDCYNQDGVEAKVF